MVRLLVFAFFFLLSTFVQAQDRFFVFFNDKTNSTFSTSNPSSFLSPKTVARRVRLGIPITEEDLPVNATYVAQVKATGAKTFFTSKWFNGVLVQTDATTVTTIEALPFVKKVERVARGVKLINGRLAKAEQKEMTQGQSTDFQLNQLDITQMQAENFLGQNLDIAQFDSGWRGVDSITPFYHLLTSGRIKETKNFVRNTADVFSDDAHGTSVLSVMAGRIAGEYSGGAYQANFYLYETEDVDDEYRIEEYNWTFAAERADSIGVDVINSSVGYNQFDDATMNYTQADLNGKTSVVSRAAKKATDKGIVVVTSAGNEGGKTWRSITMPADVDGIITVGAITTDGLKSSFSSIGPTADGRIKPDVVALGTAISVINFSGNVTASNGTSFSSPLIASLVAGLIQEFPNKSPKQIYQAIIYSANQYRNPDNQLGYGIPNYSIAKSYLYYGQPSESVFIFPNPTQTNLKVLIKDPIGQPISILLSDYFGRNLINTTTSVDWTTNPIQLDISTLPSGMYILEVKTGGVSEVMKVMKR